MVREEAGPTWLKSRVSIPAHVNNTQRGKEENFIDEITNH
jgi:hypothetical protein